MVRDVRYRDEVDVDVGEAAFAEVFFVHHCGVLGFGCGFLLVCPYGSEEFPVGPFETYTESAHPGK